MRILNVNPSLDPIEGGTTQRTYHMTCALLRAGHKVRLLVTDKGMVQERREQFTSSQLWALPCMNERFYVPTPSSSNQRMISTAVSEAEIIHLMGHWTLINALVYREARRLGKPYVVCPAGSLPLFGRSRTLKKLYNWAVGLEMLRHAARVIAITRAELHDFEFYSIDPDKVTVIPNAINPEDYAPRNNAEFRFKYKLGPEPIILFLGRLNPIKGADLLLEAFASAGDELRGFQLVYAGPDEGMREDLVKFASKHSIAGRVHFIGHLSNPDKSYALNAATLLAIPSRQEAMSIVALEAGAAGRPVLLTDRCGFEEIEEIGGGRVVPANALRLELGLKEMLLSKETLLEEMGSKLKNYILKRFSWDRMVERYVDTYSEILSGKG